MKARSDPAFLTRFSEGARGEGGETSGGDKGYVDADYKIVDDEDDKKGK